jgi:aldose 1-epimerase
MAVRTDQPGVQLYTGNNLRDPFVTHGSVSLETQCFPDTPNRPELGSARLGPGERYANVTELRFGTGRPPGVDDVE